MCRDYCSQSFTFSMLIFSRVIAFQTLISSRSYLFWLEYLAEVISKCRMNLWLYFIIIELILNLNLVEIITPTNMKLIIQQQPIVSLFQSPPTSLMTPLTSNYFSEKEKEKSQLQYQILKWVKHTFIFYLQNNQSVWEK